MAAKFAVMDEGKPASGAILARILQTHVDMIRNSTDQNGRAIEFFCDSSEKRVNLPANILVRQKRESLFGGEDDVQKDAGQRLGQGDGIQPRWG